MKTSLLGFGIALGLYGSAAAQPSLGSPMAGLEQLKDFEAMRESSSDPDWHNGNADSRPIEPGGTLVLADLKGPGVITHFWNTIAHPAPFYPRLLTLRMYWDGEEHPSVECPIGDFFGIGHGLDKSFVSLPIKVSSDGRGRNCYWPMPFRKKARITMENRDAQDMILYYQINYALAPVPKSAAYFHAQFRRESPLKQKGLYTILDGVAGQGHYVGTYLAWEVHSPGWWGEGEIKFFMDGDRQFPTICGTGTEDYFCGSYNFENRETKKYQVFCTPYAGLAQVLPPDRIYEVGQRFGLYRWHIPDPVRFKKDLKVTIQALGWQEGGRYLPLEDDIASVAYWYQKEPHQAFPKLPPNL